MTVPSPVYDPRDLRCKKPYGAVPSGTAVTFTLRPQRAEGFSHGILTARFEFLDNKTVTLPMDWEDHDLPEGRDLFFATLKTGDYVGLVWYSFRLEGFGGQIWGSQEEYQLTIYDNAGETPSWFGVGMTYQIFPDRFFRTAIPNPAGMVGSRTVHSDWEELPEYCPDGEGKIRNRDFFGGSLAGITKKLDYLGSLGVETLYLCPVFEGAENHRYGTGDYEKIDPMLGSQRDFEALCLCAHRRGMRVLLDGVFSHTGFISRYFGGDSSYRDLGAAQSLSSPYADWFTFSRWPDKYDCWWGIATLPAVKKSCASYVDYIIEDKNSIVRRWLRAGADGWRLDVADELPDEFIARFHQAVRQEKPDAVVIGEVWEDGTNKISYGVRRRHLLGGHCDALMNYPFRSALLAFLLGGDAREFMEAMETLREHYPPAAYYSAMNILGTHDTPRILTLLGAGSACGDCSRDWRAEHRLSEEERKRGAALLKLALLALFAFPGSPTVYYGDEAGLEGFEDPFNRRTFPWGREDQEPISYISSLGKARKTFLPLRRGDICYMKAEGRVLAFTRTYGGQTVLAAVNAGDSTEEISVFEEERLILPPVSGQLLAISREGKARVIVNSIRDDDFEKAESPGI